MPDPILAHVLSSCQHVVEPVCMLGVDREPRVGKVPFVIVVVDPCPDIENACGLVNSIPEMLQAGSTTMQEVQHAIEARCSRPCRISSMEF